MTAKAFNRQLDIKYFLESEECNLIFFHDSVELVKELSVSGVLENSHVYFTTSWFLNEEKFGNIKRYFLEAEKSFGDVYDRVTLLLNSKLEMEMAERIIPEVDVLHFSNASLINETLFDILRSPQDKQFDAVFNARPNAFKRHYLTQLIESKLFIAYEWKVTDVDLEAYGPTKIYMNVKGSEVGLALNEARVGLMLSEEEGACYASTEYLLCGLPVVSTASRGGRDEYYNEGNSIICEASAESVQASTRKAVESLARDIMVPGKIRSDCIDRMSFFRNSLEAHMQSRLKRAGVSAEDGLLTRRVHSTNKLWKYRNMRLKSIFSENQQMQNTLN